MRNRTLIAITVVAAIAALALIGLLVWRDGIKTTEDTLPAVPEEPRSTAPTEDVAPGGVAPTGSIGAPLRKRGVYASRIFAGPNQYPPTEFAAYGIVAFRSRASPYDRDRHLMICNAYVASLPHASELSVPRAEQMVTVWPLDRDDLAAESDPERKDICDTAVNHYGLVTAQGALKDAALAGVDTTGTGPFLLAWSPATGKGNQDVPVLVSDLSEVTTYEQAYRVFLAWSHDIESDPTVWRNGWNLERLRSTVRYWVDKYGSRSLALFGVKG